MSEDWRGEHFIRAAKPTFEGKQDGRSTANLGKFVNLANLAKTNPAITTKRAAEIMGVSPSAVTKRAQRLGLKFADGRKSRA